MTLLIEYTHYSRLIPDWATSDHVTINREDLRSCWNQGVEQFAARPETTGTVIRPVQAVTEEIFIWTVTPRHSVNSFNCTV